MQRIVSQHRCCIIDGILSKYKQKNTLGTIDVAINNNYTNTFRLFWELFGEYHRQIKYTQYWLYYYLLFKINN